MNKLAKKVRFPTHLLGLEDKRPMAGKTADQSIVKVYIRSHCSTPHQLSTLLIPAQYFVHPIKPRMMISDTSTTYFIYTNVGERRRQFSVISQDEQLSLETCVAFAKELQISGKPRETFLNSIRLSHFVELIEAKKPLVLFNTAANAEISHRSKGLTGFWFCRSDGLLTFVEEVPTASTPPPPVQPSDVTALLMEFKSEIAELSAAFAPLHEGALALLKHCSADSLSAESYLPGFGMIPPCAFKELFRERKSEPQLTDSERSTPLPSDPSNSRILPTFSRKPAVQSFLSGVKRNELSLATEALQISMYIGFFGSLNGPGKACRDHCLAHFKSRLFVEPLFHKDKTVALVRSWTALKRSMQNWIDLTGLSTMGTFQAARLLSLC